MKNNEYAPPILIPHIFFTIHNLAEARRSFVDKDVLFPEFQYGALPYDDVIHEEQNRGLNPVLTLRDKRRHFILAARSLHMANDKDAISSALAQYRQQVANLYGQPRHDYATAILKNIRRRCYSKYQKTLWQYIEQRISLPTESEISRPSPSLFFLYRSYFRQYASWLYDKTERFDSMEAALLFALEKSGAKAKGWRLTQDIAGANLRVSYRKKEVIIGKDFVLYSSRGCRKLLAHEIYGHVNRYAHSKRHFPLWEAEGVAVLLEQLLGTKFSVSRSYRYLAVSIGWGVFGEPKDFRQCFEIIWRAMCIVSKYPEDVAKKKAFNECVRVFRSGRPDVAGAVFTKDVGYFEGNMRVWDYLATERPRFDEFVDIIEGRKIIGVE